MNKLVAVYGTLRQGEGNHQILKDSEYISTSLLSGFKMYGNSNFPAVIKGEKEDVIVIEIYKITNSEVAKELDILEGFDRSNPDSLNNLYTVRMITVPSIRGMIEIYTFASPIPDDANTATNNSLAHSSRDRELQLTAVPRDPPDTREEGVMERWKNQMWDGIDGEVFVPWTGEDSAGDLKASPDQIDLSGDLPQGEIRGASVRR